MKSQFKGWTDKKIGPFKFGFKNPHFGGMKVAWALEHGALHILALKTVCSDQSRVLFFSLLLRVASESNKVGQASLGMNYNYVSLCFSMVRRHFIPVCLLRS